jgi:hypothetical protein
LPRLLPIALALALAVPLDASANGTDLVRAGPSVWSQGEQSRHLCFVGGASRSDTTLGWERVGPTPCSREYRPVVVRQEGRVAVRARPGTTFVMLGAIHRSPQRLRGQHACVRRRAQHWTCRVESARLRDTQMLLTIVYAEGVAPGHSTSASKDSAPRHNTAEARRCSTNNASTRLHRGATGASVAPRVCADADVVGEPRVGVDARHQGSRGGRWRPSPRGAAWLPPTGVRVGSPPATRLQADPSSAGAMVGEFPGGAGGPACPGTSWCAC